MAQLKDTTVNGTLMVNDVNVNDKMDLVDELNTKLSFTTETFTQTVSYGENTTVTFNISKSGYKPLAVVSLVPGIGYGALLNYNLYNDDTFKFTFRNAENNNTYERTATIKVLYIKN